MPAPRASAALLAAWALRALRAAAESYTSFDFVDGGVAETFEVSAGVTKPYTVSRRTFYSQGFELLPGQMLFTDPHKTKIPMPGGDYAILGIVGDIVNDDASGAKVATPLNEVYDHHWIISDMRHKNYLCPQAPNYVFGVGSESRNTGVSFPKGYGYVVEGLDARVPWGANIHLLRVDSGEYLVGDSPAEAMKECNECFFAPGKNAGCDAAHNGTFECCGDRCYEKNCFCPVNEGTVMSPKTYYLRMVVDFTTDVKSVTPLGVGTYTTPNCAAYYAAERNDENPYHLSSTTFDIEAEGTMLLAIGHAHVGNVNVSMFHNDRFVCASIPRYGQTQGLAGDEKGFLVQMSECFNKDKGQSLSFKQGDKIRIDSWYFVGSDDPRIAPLPGGTHLNIMGYMYIAYDATQTVFDEVSVGLLPTKGCEVGFHHTCGKLLGFPLDCLACVDEHRKAIDGAGCDVDVAENMCQFRSPHGGVVADGVFV